MDNRRDKDKEFDKAQAMDRLTQDDKDKMSLIKMMMDKEKKSMKERKAIPSDRAMDKAIDKDQKIRDMKEEEFIDGMIIKLVVAKRGVDADIAKSFIDTHYEDIIDAENTDDILDEFDEFMSVNTEYVREEDNLDVDFSDAAAGDDAIERESASGAFEEAINWRGETLKEQFKRLTK